ncbi:MAG: HEAT repeat domain-containing protein [Desulfobacteraceae bacterium]|nr:MAG: HEAT repeat domain-containing protein [Desulfobacteraceae bacterium]
MKPAQGAVSGRALKRTVRDLLAAADFNDALDRFLTLPLQKIVSPLFGFLLDRDELVRWRAVSAMGLVVSVLADTHMESARVIMRRMMWQLNDESGGIGWGIPEAMGEVMARHEKLAAEYANILMSYVSVRQNFLEHDVLQQGVLWGIGRLAAVCPERLAGVDADVMPFLDSKYIVHRGLAAWTLGNLRSARAAASLPRLADDSAVLTIYDHENYLLTQTTVGGLARTALSRINKAGNSE